MINFLERAGIEEATVLEIGGGVGEVQIELLRMGASRALNLELSAAYENEAAQLLQEAGAAGRAQRRIHDIAVDPEAVAPADVVVLNRVVCCYPDYSGSSAQQPTMQTAFSCSAIHVETRSPASSSLYRT